MAKIIYSLSLPYLKFEIGKVIDPSEFNVNNSAIQSKINEAIDAINNFQILDPEGNVVIPSYIKETFIDPVEIRSPLITGNTLIGASGIVGMTSVGTANDSVRFWAGSSVKESAPFQVRHDGGVTMTKATIETVTDANSLYIKMSGSKIDAGKTGDEPMYTLGTASLTAGSRSGIFQSNGYLSGSTKPDLTMQITHNTVMVKGSNLVLGGASEDRTVVIARKINTSHHQLSIPADAALHVVGNINLTGDIYKNGVKMQLVPA